MLIRNNYNTGYNYEQKNVTEITSSRANINSAYINSYGGYGYPNGWYAGGISRPALQSFYSSFGANYTSYPGCCGKHRQGM